MSMKVTQKRYTEPTTVSADSLNAALDVIVAAKGVLARRTTSRSTFTNRIPSHVLDELDGAIRQWDAVRG